MTEEEKISYWYTFNRFQKTREKKYAPKIDAALKKQIEAFIAAYTRGDRDPYAAVTLVPIIEVLKPLYVESAVIYGAKVIAGLPKKKARMPIGYSERMQRLVEQYFSEDFLNDSQDITETTKKYIREVLERAQASGIGYAEIVKELRSPDMTKARSRLIARTETVKSSNFGAAAAAKDTGLSMNKVWIAARDKRTRRDHVMADGQTIPQDAAFSVGKESIQMLYPGDKGGKDGRLKVPAKELCNCRCTHAYIPLRDSSGMLVSA